jgi:hypothetical protein
LNVSPRWLLVKTCNNGLGGNNKGCKIPTSEKEVIIFIKLHLAARCTILQIPTAGSAPAIALPLQQGV